MQPISLHSAALKKGEVQTALLIGLGADPSASYCNTKKPLRLLLEDVPNFRNPYWHNGANFWPIAKAIIAMLGTKLSTDDLRMEIDFVQSIKGDLSNRNA